MRLGKDTNDTISLGNVQYLTLGQQPRNREKGAVALDWAHTTSKSTLAAKRRRSRNGLRVQLL